MPALVKRRYIVFQTEEGVDFSKVAALVAALPDRYPIIIGEPYCGKNGQRYTLCFYCENNDEAAIRMKHWAQSILQTSRLFLSFNVGEMWMSL